jgi:hypothetical protein
MDTLAYCAHFTKFFRGLGDGSLALPDFLYPQGTKDTTNSIKEYKYYYFLSRKFFICRKNNMTVKFCLKMKDAIINGTSINYLEVAWEEELTARELAARFHVWLNDQTFIERKLPDLENATFCQLFINPS